MSAGRIALLVTGIVAAIVSLALLAGGGFLLWATTQRDEDGFYNTRSEPFQSDGYAIRSEDLDLGTEGPDWVFEEGNLGTIRLVADGSRRLFLGIGPKADVERYLRGVEHDVVTDVELDPFRVTYDDVPGNGEPAPPRAQAFWVATSEGEERLEWKVAEGDWAAVVMNADGSRGVSADVSVGAKTDLLLWAGLIVLGFGVLFGAAGVALIVFGARRPHPVPAATAPPGAGT
jgi:hypothetical protein